MRGPPALRTEDVVKSFGGLRALDGVTLEIPPNSLTMLIGPNGSGKTTLINVITGVYKPDRGRVLLNGRDITGLAPHEVYRAGVSRTFQIPALFTKLTVLENLLVAARAQRGESPFWALVRGAWLPQEGELVERAFRIMRILRIDHLWDHRASELSGGQMKLLEIGRALMSDPRVLLMDEPVAGVNPKLAHEIMDHLLRLRDRLGISLLIVEHRLDIVIPYVDVVYAMHQGRVIARGRPDEVLKNEAVIRSYLGD